MIDPTRKKAFLVLILSVAAILLGGYAAMHYLKNSPYAHYHCHCCDAQGELMCPGTPPWKDQDFLIACLVRLIPAVLCVSFLLLSIKDLWVKKK